MIFGSLHDVSIPAIGLGTWDLHEEDCVRTVSFALQNGYRHVDTAVYYGNEKDVGEGIRASGVDRTEVFLTTKVWWDQLSAEALLRSAEDSVKRLGTGYVDLLLVHWPNPDISLKETIGGLLEAKSRGLTKSIGVSNFPSVLLWEAQELADGHLITNQVEYHPFLSQNTLLQTCADLGMTLTAYCPIIKGRVADEPVLAEIAEKHGKSPVQVTLRWHMQQDNVIAIPKSSNPDRLKANLDIFDFELSRDDMRRISALGSPAGRTIHADFAPDWDVD
ncbi:aldo/keto reductase [Roseibium sp.]|uniref:aldo/keto reductase n=1 Tax=Roseibium sp. TaxID=1936156 RepID=UPI003B52182A